MQIGAENAIQLPLILEIYEGDWISIWRTLGIGFAHDVLVGFDGTVYENSGPGGKVRRNKLTSVLRGAVVVNVISRASNPSEVVRRVTEAERMLNTPWSVFYNCQDFASEVVTGLPRSFQRDAVVGLGIVFLAGMLWGNSE